MPERPRLSLCIPTCNGAGRLETLLVSVLREASEQPTGTVEVLVCDFASTDGTPERFSKLAAGHPGMRIARTLQRLGFDRDYLRCLEEARGELVWVLDPDAEWLPGSVARVMRDLEAGADACQCLARACHPDSVLPGLRKGAVDDAAWQALVPPLIRAGFPTARIAAVDFAHRHLYGERQPMPTLNPAALCLADLPLVARGARHIAVLALGGVENILNGAGLLATFSELGRVDRIRVYAGAEAAGLLDGFAFLPVDSARYARDEVYREATVRDLVDFAPELAVNLDPGRGIEADDLVSAALPAGAVAYDLPQRGQDARLVLAANGAYSRLVRVGVDGALCAALDMREVPPALWPSLAARQEARAVLAPFGWDPQRTLAVLVDDPSDLEDPAFQCALAAADKGGWTLVGLGDPASYRLLDGLLAPREDRAMNLAGVLELNVTAALLQQLGGFLGGDPRQRSLARACGCLAFVGAPEH